jgi:hypothetical protein
MDTKKTTLTVVQEGNRRGNKVSADEIKQAVNDLTSWFQTHAKDIGSELSKRKPVSESNLKNLKTAFPKSLPSSVETVLSVLDGGLLVKDNYRLLSAEGIMEADDLLRISMYWNKGYIPIGQDDDNNYLCLEQENGEEKKIVAWCNDMGVIEEVADGLGLLLEKVRDSLLKKKLQYIEGAGLVENSD